MATAGERASWNEQGYFIRRGFVDASVTAPMPEATLENGCLWVVPGTHTDPVHEHVFETRRDSPYKYMEIVDQDTGAEVPVTMAEGDLLVFDSHLMHRSTDNVSDGIRGAMVYHFSPAGTEDRTPPHRNINDWLPVRRGAS